MRYYNSKNYLLDYYHTNLMEVNLNPQGGLDKHLIGFHIMHVKSYYVGKVLTLRLLNVHSKLQKRQHLPCN